MTPGPLVPALLSPAWPPDGVANGVVSYIADIAGGLCRLGHRPCVLAQSIRGPFEVGDLPVIDLPALETRASRLADRIGRRIAPEATFDRSACRAIIRGVKKAIAEHGANLLEMEEAFGWPLLVASKIDVPMVVRLHGPWFANGPLRGAVDDHAFRRRVALEREAIIRADAITAPSRNVLEQTRAYYGLPLPEAEVIANPGPIVPPEYRWRPEAADASTVLFIGRFDRHKGGDVLIDAFVRVAAARPEARLVFIGPDHGYRDDAGRPWSLTDYLRDRAGDLLSAGRIEWRGQRPRSEAAVARLGAGVTVVASRYETFGIAVTEAMAQGCPLVATRAGAIPEIVDDGRTGLLCPPADVDAMAAAILRLLDDRDLAARLGGMAAEEAERRFHPDAIAREMAAFYRRVVESGLSQRRGAQPCRT